MRTLALAACLALGGCASVVGTITRPEPYIGVKLDASAVFGLGQVDALTTIFCALDLPGSAVLDTILLPVTALLWASQDWGR